MTRPTDAVALTRELVGMDTVNPPGREEACAHRLGAVLEAAGFTVRYHRLDDGRASLVARIGSGEGRPLCLTGHIDTVPLGATPWSRPPFAAETDAGRLYGRGTSDMKSGLAAIMVAVTELAPHLAGTPGLELVFTAGEETGCIGAAALAAEPGALGRAGAILVAEPTDNLPRIGHKGALWLTARTRGVTAHGSMPERGVNALFEAARAVRALEHFRFADPPHPVMGSATLNVGTLHGGMNVNSVPDAAEIGLDIRSVPSCPHARIKAQLARELGEGVELEVVSDQEAVYTEPEDPWVQEVFAICAEHLGQRPEPAVASFFTDAGYLTPAYGNPPTIVLGPGEAAMAHQTDEYCLIERVEAAVGMYRDIVRRWCGV